ncbi:MAG: hypothetical protein HN390_03705 [Anaerolineae bacterium]|jgi:hypothetical protein|nr:hypothetical protein [Anaerolineae bacterium]MBT7189304.1 hypothetical protein [Anaerolineae bacterium]MBT7988766.1 hypothetical protein [Anaerolineae bacterium]
MKKIILLLSLILLSSCIPEMPTPKSTPPPVEATQLPQEMPDDFEISYRWTSGAIEYWYGYTITLSNEKSEINFIPNYPSNEPPVWTENLAIEDNLLNEFYVKLYDAGLFDQAWLQAEDIPAGGHTSTLIAFAYFNEYKIPYSFDNKENEKAIYALYDKIEALVPQEVMDSFMVQREQYIEEYDGEW